jgi:Bacterial Ig-like domain
MPSGLSSTRTLAHRSAVLVAVAALLAGVAVPADAQPGTRRVTTVTAIKSFSGFYHGQAVLVRGELRDSETKPMLVSGEEFIRLLGRDALPEPGTYDVKGQVLDIGRLQADDPRLSGVDLRPFGIEQGDRWPRQGEIVVLKVSSLEKATPPPAPSIRALALEPDRYVDQRVTVKGQFRARNLYGDLPQAPAEAAKPKGEFVLRSADAAIWVLGKQPKGRGFQLDTASRIDTHRWLEVTGVVRQARGIVWIDVVDIAETKPVKDTVTVDATPETPLLIPPEVLFSAPTQDETDVPLTTTVRIQFSRDIDPQSLKGRVNVSYLGAQSSERGEPQPPGITAQLRYDPGNRVLSIGFSAPLERFRTVNVELVDGITGTDGAPLKPWRLTFSLGG